MNILTLLKIYKNIFIDCFKRWKLKYIVWYKVLNLFQALFFSQKSKSYFQVKRVSSCMFDTCEGYLTFIWTLKKYFKNFQKVI